MNFYKKNNLYSQWLSKNVAKSLQNKVFLDPFFPTIKKGESWESRTDFKCCIIKYAPQKYNETVSGFYPIFSFIEFIEGGLFATKRIQYIYTCYIIPKRPEIKHVRFSNIWIKRFQIMTIIRSKSLVVKCSREQHRSTCHKFYGPFKRSYCTFKGFL